MTKNKSSLDNTKEKYWQTWIYLLPIAGIIPSIWTLSRHQHHTAISKNINAEQLRASRLSLTLVLTWLTAYALLSFSAGRATDLLAFRLLYTNALLTTGYFLTCTILMWRSCSINRS